MSLGKRKSESVHSFWRITFKMWTVDPSGHLDSTNTLASFLCQHHFLGRNELAKKDFQQERGINPFTIIYKDWCLYAIRQVKALTSQPISFFKLCNILKLWSLVFKTANLAESIRSGDNAVWICKKNQNTLLKLSLALKPKVNRETSTPPSYCFPELQLPTMLVNLASILGILIQHLN